MATARLAHAPEWVPVITRAYEHEPLYVAGQDRSGRPGMLPAFVVRRPLGGTVVTSMPFLDSGGPCAASPALATALVRRLLVEARRRGAQAVEIRSAERLAIPAAPSEAKVNLTLPLPADPDRLWQQFDGSVRNQIRKAERAGLSVDVGGVEHLSSFYEVFAERMRDLGSPVHARAFLRAVLDCFGSRARIALVRKANACIGGLLALACADRLVVPWAACRKEFFALCPNMLMYWETLRSACLERFTVFEFGRSTRGSGTYRFKRQWGAREEPLFWYTIPLAAPSRASIARDGSAAATLAATAWQRLPLGITVTLGPHLRKYLVQ